MRNFTPTGSGSDNWISHNEAVYSVRLTIDSVPGSAWAGIFRKLCFLLRVSKRSFGKVRSQAEPGNECESCGTYRPILSQKNVRSPTSNTQSSEPDFKQGMVKRPASGCNEGFVPIAGLHEPRARHAVSV